MEAAAANTKYATIDYLASNSVNKEIKASVNGEIYLIGISIFVFVIVGALFLSRCVRA